jgi:hypothetical protein
VKKTVYLSILTIVTVVCIAAGICYHIISGTIGKLFGGSGTNQTSSGSRADDKEILDDFDVIRLNVAAAEVFLESGSEFSIAYNGSEEYRPQYSVENRALTVKSGNKKVHIGTKLESTITITVPEDAVLDKIDLSVNAGNMEIRGADAKDITIDLDAGNVEVYNGTYTTVSADVDAGNLTFENCVLTSAEMDTDMGNIELKSCAFDTLEAEADMGNIEVRSSQSLDDYDIQLETDLGSITVNGQSYSGGYHATGSGTKRVEISVNMGNAELTY